MEVTYHGLSCVRLRGRDTTVVVDPPQSPLPGMARSAPDIVVRTDGTTEPEKLRVRDGSLQEVSGPGEFEVRGVSILGVPAGDTTLMRIEIDDVRVASVGRLQRQLSEQEIDALGHVDVLVVPVGGGDALSAAEATKLVNALEPAFVVPARFRSASAGGDYEPIEKFAKEMGLADGSWQMQPRLTLSGPTAADEEPRLAILEPRS